MRGARVTGVSTPSTPANGSEYRADETITVRLAFDEAVNVTGRPFVYLNVGGAPRQAFYTGGTGTRTLDFAYRVQAQDFDSDGVNICTGRVSGAECGRIVLNGGSLRAVSDDSLAELDHPSQPDQANDRVDGRPMTIVPGGMAPPAAGLAIVPDRLER